MRRKIKKATERDLRGRSKKMLACQCGRDVEVDSECISVKCWSCCQKMCPVDIKLLKPQKPIGESKPRGWQFMKEFVDADGTVYHEGVEQPKLKGKRPITDVSAIKAAQKEKSKQKKLKKKEREIKKEEKLIKEYKKKKEIKKKNDTLKQFLGE